MNKCFSTIVEDILGRTVRAEIFQLLNGNGIKWTADIIGGFANKTQVYT